MAPKGGSKAITKSCPACSKHVAVACKNCPCGHTFFVARRSAALLSKSEESKETVSPPAPDPTSNTRSQAGIRRTERVKRDKPDFYDASEYDKQRKPKSSRQRLTASVSEDRDDGLGDEFDQPANKRGRGRRRKKRGLAGDLIEDKKIEDDEAAPALSTHKQAMFGINLCEINRKLMVVNPTF